MKREVTVKKVIALLLVVCLVSCILPGYGAEAKSKAKTTAKQTKGVLDVPFYETKVCTDEMLRMTCQSICNNCRGYGFVDEEVCKYLQKEISTASEVMAYLLMAHYRYDEVEGMMGFVREGWTNSGDPAIMLSNNFGVCCETSTVVAYLLEDDYAEVGFVIVHGDSGHQYNYIKDWDGTYYLVDFTDFTSSFGNNMGISTDDYEWIWNSWKDSICFWSGKSLDSKSCREAACIHDTYEDNNFRTNYSPSWNREHTGVIIATPDMGTHVPAPTMTDMGYQSSAIKEGFFDGTYRILEFQYAIQKEAYDKSVVLFTSDRYLGGKWTVVSIDKKYIPWYISDDIIDNDETTLERMLRQCSGNTYEKINSLGTIGKKTEMVIANYFYISNYAGYAALANATSKQLKKLYRVKKIN